MVFVPAEVATILDEMTSVRTRMKELNVLIHDMQVWLQDPANYMMDNPFKENKGFLLHIRMNAYFNGPYQEMVQML